MDDSSSSAAVEGSLVEFYSSSASYCGYCRVPDRRSNGRRSYDMMAYKLSASDYQEMLDIGWRRSGENCYYPRNEITCCPNYSIVCKANKFKLSRSQRKCINNINSFLLNGDGDDSTNNKPLRLNYNRLSSEADPTTATKTSCDTVELGRQIQATILNFDKLKASKKARHGRFVRACERRAKRLGLSQEDAVRQVVEQRHLRQQQFPHNNKVLPLESYLFPEVLIAEENDTSNACPDNTISELKKRRKLVIRMIHVDSEESKSLREAEHAIMVSYQKAVHKEEHRDWTMERYCDFLVNSPLLVERLQNYKHLGEAPERGDDCHSVAVPLRQGCDTELVVEPPNLPTSFGTYHCSYHLDGKLIGVGVLDVLPKCITTVYFFYDPNYTFLNLGIYSALVEISLVRRLSRMFSGPREENQLTYYYLGFYVHVCEKMRYKTRFRPSYLLCTKSLQYVKTELCLEKLSSKKFAIFGDKLIEGGPVPLTELLKIPIVSPVEPNNRKLYDYVVWLTSNIGLEATKFLLDVYLATYAQLVGASLLKKLCLQLSAVHRALRDRHEQSA